MPRIHKPSTKNIVCCRWAPSIGKLESTHQKVWGTKTYNPKTDIDKPCVFFGLYGLPDFIALWRHKGKRWILWAGSDIIHFENGYWLDTKGEIRLDPKPLAEWINKYCDNWCENIVEFERLLKLGIKAKIRPSFLGDVSKFKPTDGDPHQAYISSTGDRQVEYGFQEIEDYWAVEHPDITFHLYGGKWKTKRKNVVVHGRVPKAQMNREIKRCGIAMRLNEFDGCSEIIVKAVLMDQQVISKIEYPFLDSDNPREALLKILNKYPFNVRVQSK